MEDSIMENNIFEYAVRNKLRFPYKGTISTEDLWDLPVTELDKIYKVLNKKNKANEEESLLSTSSVDMDTLVSIDIIKYIVNYKLKKKEENEQAKKRAEDRQFIMNIVEKKRKQSLEDKTEEELLEMLKNM